MFRKIRIAVLLLVLVWVAVDVLADRLNTTDWKQTLWVGVYPINADGSARTERYIEGLGHDDFVAIENWMQLEGARYGLASGKPVQFQLGGALHESPPMPPRAGGWFDTTRWSLDLQNWADDHDVLPSGLKPDIRLFLLYYDPQTHPRLPHSLGLQKGLVGIVHLFADRRQAGGNRFVIAHEMLHTLGATDKYDPKTNQPLHPDGYAAPFALPLFPQKLAEIMGGRIPASETVSETPADIDTARVGPVTAAEIRWQ